MPIICPGCGFEYDTEYADCPECHTPKLISEPKSDANIGIFPELTAELEKIKAEAYQAGYQDCGAHVKQAAGSLDSYQEGFEEGKTVSVLRTIHAQAYEIISDVGIKYSAKGEPQPEASVKITRYLEDGSNLTDLIKADLARGVDEMMTAIADIQKRNAGGK